MTYIVLVARLVIGVTFAVSAFGKLRSRSAYGEFRRWLSGLPVPGILTGRSAAAVLCVTEAGIAGLQVPDRTARAGLAAAAVTLAGLAAGIWAAGRRGRLAPCRCFGKSVTPLGRPHIARNLALAAVALTGAAGSGGATPVRAAGLTLSCLLAAVVVIPLLYLDDLLAVVRAPRRDLGQPDSPVNRSPAN